MDTSLESSSIVSTGMQIRGEWSLLWCPRAGVPPLSVSAITVREYPKRTPRHEEASMQHAVLSPEKTPWLSSASRSGLSKDTSRFRPGQA